MFQTEYMKQVPRRINFWCVQLLTLLLLNGVTTGCVAAKSGHSTTNQPAGTEYLRVGDKIKVTYSDIPVPVLPTEQQIPESKKVILHLNLEVEFVGKTKTQLEKEIRDLYIKNGYYKNINIVIDVPVRMVSVGGEVRSSSTYAHSANLTLTKAINMAGGLTEFAKKRRIQITRADGTVLYVNWNKAIKDPSEDPPINPGDSIHVERSIF